MISSNLPYDLTTLPQPNRSELLSWLVAVNGIHKPGHNISKCANLAVAHSGSSSLKGYLKPLSDYTHHLHLLRIPPLYAKGARCFITTLRDPVKRLQSAFDTEKRYPGLTHSMSVRSRNRGTLWPWALIEAFRDESHASHRAVINMYRASQLVNPAKLKTSNIMKNTYNGSLSLTPQIDFLDWLPASSRGSIEIHILCTHRMDSDWQTLTRKFYGNVTEPLANRTAHANRGSMKKDDGNAYHSKDWLKLNRSDVDYVRYTMFPYDTALLLAVCGADALSEHSSPSR
jgi:hypothetical protein